MSGDLTVTGTTSLSTVNQDIFLNNAAVSTSTYRSAGTKLALYDCITSSISDYAIGVEPYNMFFIVAESSSGF